jgi:surfeit locus 1 family protein
MNFRSRPLLSVIFVVVAVICARLGVWQVSRLRERRAANAVASRARAAPPVDLEHLGGDSSLSGRRVRAEGHYDHAHDIVLRGREYQGVPGIELVSPLILEGQNAAVLVDRGFVPAPDAVTVVSDSFNEPGRKVVEGLLAPVPSGQGMPLQREGRTTWARLDLAALQSQVPYRLYRFSILQTPESTWQRFPRRQDPPPLDDGPHLNYAIQWFAFAVIALVFAGLMARPGVP